jgi:ACS family glucarate transporter-like MFS transporter
MVSTMELQHIVAGRGPQSNAARTAGAPWRSIFSSKEVLALVLSYFTYGYVAWIFFSWFYIYLAEVRGLNLKTSAVYTMLPFLAMTAGCLIGGAASDWLGRRYRARVGRSYLPAFALGCTAILLLVGSRASNALVAAAVLACGAGTLYLSQSCFFSVAADIAGEHAGVVAGTINTGGQLGGAVTASLTPLIAAHFGWEASFLTAALLAGVGALAWLLVNPEARLGSAGTSAPATR